MAEKPHLNLVFIGHVDHGKSTAIGRLLYDTGGLPEEKLRKLREIAKEAGKETFEFAFVMDRLKEERERGLTIDVAHRRFDTAKYYFTIIDAPGHRDFVKNMITGTSQADAAVLVVDAVDGVQAQTKEHLYLAKVLGVPQILVAINKMDLTKPPYNEKRYNEVVEEIKKLIKSVGYKPEKTQILPISAWKGDNTVKGAGKLEWYKGDTLLKALDTVEVLGKPIDKPLRWPVQDVYSIKGVGTVPVGRVETGVMKAGDTIIFQPADVSGEVKTIEMHHEQIPKAEPGDNVGVNIRGISRKELRRGDVAGHKDNPPTVVKSFTGQIIVLQHPSAIAVGYTPVVHCHTSQIACKFEELQKKLDPKTGATVEEKPDYLKAGDAAVVKFVPTKPLVIENSAEIPQLGSFAIRDMGQTVAAGRCVEVEKR